MVLIWAETFYLLLRQVTQQIFVAKPSCSWKSQLPQVGHIALGIYIQK